MYGIDSGLGFSYGLDANVLTEIKEDKIQFKEKEDITKEKECKVICQKDTYFPSAPSGASPDNL